MPVFPKKGRGPPVSHAAIVSNVSMAHAASTIRDQPAWQELRSMLERFVARRVGPRDVEDVLQDVFVRVSRGLPELREGERLNAWVYRIARNTIADHHRRAQREEPMEAEPIAEVDDDEPVAARDLASSLLHFVELLPPASREALELTDLEGVTQAEAARRLGLSVPGMKSRVQRARAQLRDMLHTCCAIEIDARGRVVDVAPRDPSAEPPGCCGKPRE